jgi:ABC-2 type transport system permease protein
VIGLIRSEMLRFTSRRLFRALGVLVVAGLIAAALIAFLQSSKDPNAGRVAAQQDVARCKADEARAQADAPPGTAPITFGCSSVDELARTYDKRFRYATTMPDATRGVAVAFFILSFVVAASFVGADWASGSTTTLLTWEPRRGRVFAAKVIASSILVAAAAVAALALLDVLFLPVAALRGTTAGVGGSLWWTLAGVWMRGAALAVFGACVASSIATISRNTAGAIGVAFGYGVILENILLFIRGGRLRPWLLQELFLRVIGVVPLEGAAASNVRAAILLSLYGIGALAVAYASFRARDVT